MHLQQDRDQRHNFYERYNERLQNYFILIFKKKYY